MFISIPKEFFVPVVYGERFILNEDNNNLELDTSLYRESTKINVKNNEETKEYIGTKENSEAIKIKKDMEVKNYKKVTSEESQKVKENISAKKECVELNAMYIELKSDDVKDKCKMCTDMFTQLDDEYINNVEGEKCNYKK